LSVKEAQER